MVQEFPIHRIVFYDEDISGISPELKEIILKDILISNTCLNAEYGSRDDLINPEALFTRHELMEIEKAEEAEAERAKNRQKKNWKNKRYKHLKKDYSNRR